MANERKTEQIVRKHFERFANEITIEEQSSDIPKINKLLKTASKKGSGKGYPEFIISFKNNADLLIVIECKANITKHESEKKNKYSDFAVDGVLIYASYLSKEFDVIAIAVSGEIENNLKISHFLQLKNTETAHNIFNDDTFLSVNDYIKAYKTDERKFNQDFQKLLKYSRSLNDKLHSYKVPESQRSLLISGILIALTDLAFSNSYKYQNPKELSENLIITIKNKLTSIQNKYIENIISTYSFIKTHTILSKKENILKNIIDEIDTEINNFIKNYKYFDTLGQFYIEFLRYANNDKGLGIVLTPPHITELFTEIASINKDSIVLDTCTGTGGFLISAMKKMIIDAGGDKNKELKIKSEQIIGVELQHDLFSLLCSNMFIHGDGRSNLLKGNCFDDNIKISVKKHKPNVGFLNPPYKTSKNDPEELEFIYNNLEQLEKGALCVAIIPSSCALADKGTGFEAKKKLLKNHTLEAVFSMPNELFYNSNVSVSTCVMVFRAKEKHAEKFKTYFGLWKDDNFVKIKNIGRIDLHKTWSKIKDNWLNNYKNRDEIIGESIKINVNAKDEWLAENYIKINYLETKKSDFQEFIRNYTGNSFLIKKIDFIDKKPAKKKDIFLKDRNYNFFKLIDIYNIKKGERLIKSKRIEGKIPLLTSKSLNNGISGFIDYEHFIENKSIYSKKITIDMLANVFYHGYKYFSDDNIHTLIIKDKYENFGTEFVSIFIATLLQKIVLRYNYGRQVRLKRLENETIMLPVNDDNKIDWEFMENYIKSLDYSSSI